MSEVKAPKLPFVDAQEQQRSHPNTFSGPSDLKLSKIVEGSIVKVCTGAERFWVIVSEVEGNKFIGKVDNNLMRSDTHGLVLNDMVEFEQRHVYAISEV